MYPYRSTSAVCGHVLATLGVLKVARADQIRRLTHIFLGLDVGKGEHHATAVTPAGKKAFDKRLPNTEPKLRELFAELQAKHGTVLFVVDQPASIGALPLAVARDMGCPVAYLPGLTMRRIADLYPGEDETIVELGMIVGFDDDLAGKPRGSRTGGTAPPCGSGRVNPSVPTGPGQPDAAAAARATFQRGVDPGRSIQLKPW